jgi:transposase
MERERYDLNVDHSDGTKVEPLRRVEAIAGVERRWNWSTDEKLSIVAECMAEGVVISDVARRHGLSPQQLCGGRSQFKARAAELLEQRAPAFAPAIVMIRDRRRAARAAF